MTAPQQVKRQRQRISMNPRGPQPYPYKTTTVRIPADLKDDVIEMSNRFKANALNQAGRRNKMINP